jgi:curli biogenesis system outer membrane secretion channel CsgG
MRLVGTALAATLAVCFASSFASAASKKNEPPEVKHCSKEHGTLAVKDAQNEWWRAYNLGNPQALIKLIVQRSGCFKLVDRGQGLEMMKSERELGGEDELQPGQQLGKGQMVAADYFLLPDIVDENANSGGNALGGAVGGLLGGRVGGLFGGIKTKKMEAHTVLTLTNARTGVQEQIAEGTAKKTDLSFGAGGGIFGAGLGLAAAGGGYSNTDIGKVIATAYIITYNNMVDQIDGMATDAKASAPLPAQRMVEAARLYKEPKDKAAVVRMLREGTLVYPTGNKSDIYWEVQDANGNKGWVSSEFIEPAK